MWRAGLLALMLYAPAGLQAEAPPGDPARGAEIYGRCKACHSLQRDRTGPRHCGLFGRKAGSVDGFAYSRAMRRSGVVWSAATLDAFLKDTRSFMPKNRMGYAGIEDDRDRADLIAYLWRQRVCE